MPPRVDQIWFLVSVEHLSDVNSISQDRKLGSVEVATVVGTTRRILIACDFSLQT